MTTIQARPPYTPPELGAQYNRAEIRTALGYLARSVPPMVMRTVSADTTIAVTDDAVLCDATDDPIVVTLPLAAQVQYLVVSIKKIDSSGHAVTITPSGSDTIDGAATVSLGTQYKSRTIQSDGSGWWVLASV